MVDSLKIFEILKASSLPDEHARAMTLAIQKAESEIALDVKAVVFDLKAFFEQQFSHFREDYATKVDLAEMEARLMRWTLGLWVAQMTATIGIVLAAFKLFR